MEYAGADSVLPTRILEGASLSELQLIEETRHTRLAGGIYSQRVLEEPLRLSRSYSWLTDARDISSLQDLDPLLCQIGSSGDGDAVIAVEGCLGLIQLYSGNVSLHASGGVQKIEKLLAIIKGSLPEIETKNNELAFKFWWLTDHGPRNRQRMIEVPNWQDISDNYPLDARFQIEGLMDLQEAPKSGQLILWHGPPGTGKTWCLRALAYTWREWCDFEFVSDPERFFGKAEYMTEVLLEGSDLWGRERWRLLVLEDTGELLVRDAKERIGQGLSRFLNTVDGLIGQGLKTLVLVSTNEDLGSLHPAVSRPGRCSAIVGFDPFPLVEAQEWLRRVGIECSRKSRPMTLAEMYALASGYELNENVQKKIGFV
jgi:hypothetical protein